MERNAVNGQVKVILRGGGTKVMSVKQALAYQSQQPGKQLHGMVSKRFFHRYEAQRLRREKKEIKKRFEEKRKPKPKYVVKTMEVKETLTGSPPPIRQRETIPVQKTLISGGKVALLPGMVDITGRPAKRPRDVVAPGMVKYDISKLTPTEQSRMPEKKGRIAPAYKSIQEKVAEKTTKKILPESFDEYVKKYESRITIGTPLMAVPILTKLAGKHRDKSIPSFFYGIRKGEYEQIRGKPVSTVAEYGTGYGVGKIFRFTGWAKPWKQLSKRQKVVLGGVGGLYGVSKGLEVYVAPGAEKKGEVIGRTSIELGAFTSGYARAVMGSIKIARPSPPPKNKPSATKPPYRPSPRVEPSDAPLSFETGKYINPMRAREGRVSVFDTKLKRRVELTKQQFLRSTDPSFMGGFGKRERISLFGRRSYGEVLIPEPKPKLRVRATTEKAIKVREPQAVDLFKPTSKRTGALTVRGVRELGKSRIKIRQRQIKDVIPWEKPKGGEVTPWKPKDDGLVPWRRPGNGGIIPWERKTEFPDLKPHREFPDLKPHREYPITPWERKTEFPDLKPHREPPRPPKPPKPREPGGTSDWKWPGGIVLPPDIGAGGGYGFSWRWPGRRGTGKSTYTASLAARTLGIYGKRPKGMISGLEFRPMVGKKPKKKGKKSKGFFNFFNI